MDIGKCIPNKWPKLLDMTKDECRKSLRALELSAYSQTVSVLRAQGELTKEKRKLLNDLQTIFSISLERHRAEIRRAVNDEKLNTIAEALAGPNTGVEWAVEGRRLVPLMPRVPPQTAYTALATRMALLYYGMNAKMPPPSSTALFGKMDDLGAESGDTDSEEETDGLRFIPGSMVPPHYNSDQGSYTTLPQSQARLSRLPSKENRENRETPTTTASSGGMGPMSIGSGSSSGIVGSDKRKRKRSLSTEHPLPLPPPPPPAPREPPTAPGTPGKQMSGLGRPIAGPPMKITVTGNVTRGTSGTPVSTFGGHTQKVILVSTSGASGVGGGMYQRSLSVPVMKSGSGPTPAVMRGVPTAPGSLSSAPIQPGGSIGSGSMIVPSTYAGSGPTVSGGVPSSAVPPGTYVNRMRPRIPSGTIPPRPRQRSNSLLLQTEPSSQQRNAESGTGGGSNTMTSGSHLSTIPSFSGGHTVVGTPSVSSHSMTPAHLMTHQTIQVRPGAPVPPGKAAIQIRQEGTSGAKIITHGVSSCVGGPGNIPSSGNSSSSVNLGPAATGRLMSRAPLLPPNSPQGSGGPLYVVTTNSGTITVVTRTVAAGQGTGPRVVTVNTINAPKASVGGLRAASPATMVSVGPKTVQTVRVTPQGPAGLRPVLGGPKSNVIVVHKGAPTPGTRPMGLQGIRDVPNVPTKITIGKTLSGNSSTTVLQKPPSAPRGPIANPSLVPTGPPTSQGNVIVVDLNPESTTVSSTGSLADILQAADGSIVTTNSSRNSSMNTSAISGSAATTSSSISTLSNLSTSNAASNTIAIPKAINSISSNTTSNSSAEVSTATGGSSAPTPVVSVAPSSGEGDGEWLNLGLEGEDSPGHNLPEGQMQMLEEAVEILGRGDKESARNLLRQAGIELYDSPGDIGEHGGETTSMASLMAGLASQLPGGHLEDGSLAPVGELDPATGLFYNPSSSDSSSDTNSNSASEDLETEERESPE